MCLCADVWAYHLHDKKQDKSPIHRLRRVWQRSLFCQRTGIDDCMHKLLNSSGVSFSKVHALNDRVSPVTCQTTAIVPGFVLSACKGFAAVSGGRCAAACRGMTKGRAALVAGGSGGELSRAETAEGQWQKRHWFARPPSTSWRRLCGRGLSDWPVTPRKLRARSARRMIFRSVPTLSLITPLSLAGVCACPPRVSARGLCDSGVAA